MSALLAIAQGAERWQPQYQKEIQPRWKAGLAFALLPGVGFGYPAGNVTQPSNFGVFSDLAAGQAYKSTASATKSWNTACGSLGVEYTALVIASYVASQPFLADDSPTSNLLIQCGGAAGKFVATAYNTSGTAYSATSQAVSTNEQVTGAIIGVRVSQSLAKVRITVDGVTTSTTTTGTLRAPSSPRIGGLKAGTAPNAIIALAAMWTYVMPDGELAELLANPYGMFRTGRRWYLPAAASGSVGAATSKSVAQGIEGYIARAVGASVAQAVEGYIGTAQGRSVVSGISQTGSVGSAIGKSIAQALEGFVAQATGRSISSAIEGYIAQAVSKSIASASSQIVSVGTAVGRSIVVGNPGALSTGSAVGASLANAVPLQNTLGVGGIVVPRTVLLQGDITPAMREWMALVTQALTAQVSSLVAPTLIKGDLWGFSTADARVPVGAPGTKLTADPSSPTGVSWQ